MFLFCLCRCSCLGRCLCFDFVFCLFVGGVLVLVDCVLVLFLCSGSSVVFSFVGVCVCLSRCLCSGSCFEGVLC